MVAFLVFLSMFEQAGKNLVVKTGVTLILSVILSYATTTATNSAPTTTYKNLF
ncbi:hypothetical protein GCM10017706_28650 [Lactococcus lactis subsp. hordniae]